MDVRRHFGLFRRVHVPPAIRALPHALQWCHLSADGVRLSYFTRPNLVPRSGVVHDDCVSVETMMNSARRLTVWRLRRDPQNIFDVHVGWGDVPDGCFWERRCIVDSNFQVFQSLVASLYQYPSG